MVRIGNGVAKALSIPRVFLVTAGLLLGLLLMGAPAEVNTQETNVDGDLRLVDTTTGTVVSLVITVTPSGRLEVFDDPDGDGAGEWKGICDDGLGTLGTQEDNDIRVIGRQEAEVACRQLGFSGGTPLTGLAVSASAAEENLAVSYKYSTRSGAKLIARSGTSVQEVFVITKNPEELKELIELLGK